ncbi:hypothetical protein, partial [Escherichia coli]|uniref:hypothetical protein n=1 Tax=Escherichia coli TaxID=562 RepID=UPI0037550B27
EWVHVQLHQQKGMISLSPPTICNSAEHGEIRQFGKPRHCAANRRGQYQTTLRDQAGRYRTVSIISLYAWEA